jgi:hypothetical protein
MQFRRSWSVPFHQLAGSNRTPAEHAWGVPIAVTMGDPAGIGPEIWLKALNNRSLGAPPVVLFGDGEVLKRCGQQAALAVPPIAKNLTEAVLTAASNGVAVLHIESLPPSWSPGVLLAMLLRKRLWMPSADWRAR